MLFRCSFHHILSTFPVLHRVSSPDWRWCVVWIGLVWLITLIYIFNFTHFYFCFNGGNKNVTWQNGESCATFLGPDQSSRHINSERLEMKLKIELLFTGFQIKRVNWEELVGCERAFQNKSVWRGFVQYTTPMEKIPLTLQDMQIFFVKFLSFFPLNSLTSTVATLESVCSYIHFHI